MAEVAERVWCPYSWCREYLWDHELAKHMAEHPVSLVRTDPMYDETKTSTCPRCKGKGTIDEVPSKWGIEPHAFCTSEIIIRHEHFGCMLQRDKDGDHTEHESFTSVPCADCYGLDEHTEECPTKDTTTEAGLYLRWNDEGWYWLETHEAHHAPH